MTKLSTSSEKKISGDILIHSQKELKKKPTKANMKLDNKLTKSNKTLNTGDKKTNSPSTKKLTSKTKSCIINFRLKFNTKPGQTLFITGNHNFLGNNIIAKALPMEYFNESFWAVTIELDIKTITHEKIIYNYFLKSEDSSLTFDWGNDKTINSDTLKTENLLIIDSWNHAGYFENSFYTTPFKNVLLKDNYTPLAVTKSKIFTHTFKIKAPLLKKGETICISGNIAAMGSWKKNEVILLSKKSDEDFFFIQLDLSKSSFPIAYKYGVYNVQENEFLNYEEGNNRVLFDFDSNNKKTIVNDGFALLPNNTWKGAGVAIPVFSLRSNNSCGVGEFSDLHLLVDWANKAGLKLIQILPINDTTATYTFTDSYPYSAISAFALHPIYLNLEKMLDAQNNNFLDEINDQKIKLNEREALDYEAVINFKWKIIKQLYPLQNEKVFASDGYKKYLDKNKHWLYPYAAFCYLRDKNKTADFSKWPLHKDYVIKKIEKFFRKSFKDYDQVAIHFFIQYHLHLQLSEAAKYAHENGIVIKGDIPIGIFRNSVDAWQHPTLFNGELQAGAPPDDFAITGQNWGFPIYKWDQMQQDGFAWWKQRFEQMSDYFDAFRIDHILGFFRIWSIPANAVEGIMGHFEPAIAVHINEFNEKNIWFDYARYCKPYITDAIIWDEFRLEQIKVKNKFLDEDGDGYYILKPEFATQHQVENYFANQEQTNDNHSLKQKLFSLISNVILFEVEGSNGQQYHFRFGMEKTSSFQKLDKGLQQQLKELYVNYFFERQDTFWMQEAMNKLPAMKRVTNMLVCGEDLGLVPRCVPEVMNQLGLLSLEIQRMPKNSDLEFFHPNDGPYLSVVTPSTHDMSTIRGWWEEDRVKTQRFFNFEMGQMGDAPHLCDAWINKAIVLQHLYAPAMWSIFQLQDLLGMDKKIRRENPNEERINIPANAKHYWNYRVHLTLESLINAVEFNKALADDIAAAGRGIE